MIEECAQTVSNRKSIGQLCLEVIPSRMFDLVQIRLDVTDWEESFVPRRDDQGTSRLDSELPSFGSLKSLLSSTLSRVSLAAPDLPLDN